MNKDLNPELQRNVQRLLGRCMLRLQQYERLLKAVLAHHELAGPVDELEARRAARVDKLSDKTLGTLVKALLESYVVADGWERDLLPEDRTPTDRISIAVGFCVSMSADRLAQTRAATEELVALRNELVHHLIERFDVWSEHGCVAATSHLQDCYARIDRHLNELVEWARGTDEARAIMTSFSQTETFHDLVVNGIAPDGSFDWSGSGIVRALQQAAQTLSKDGWVRLDRARVWMEESCPEQVPLKYSCRTWPQVLGESRLFELQYRTGDNGRKVAWFRERPT